MQGIESVEGCGERGIAGWVSTAPRASGMDRPAAAQQMADRSSGDRFRVSARRALDPGDRGCQLASHRESAACGSFSGEFPEQGARAIVEIEQSSPARAVAAIEIAGRGRPAHRPAGQFRVRHRRVAQPGVSAQPALLSILRRLEMSRCRLIHPCHRNRRSPSWASPGSFPAAKRSRNSGTTSAAALIRRARCPAGRWLIDPGEAFDPRIGAGRSRLLDAGRVRSAGTVRSGRSRRSTGIPVVRSSTRCFNLRFTWREPRGRDARTERVDAPAGRRDPRQHRPSGPERGGLVARGALRARSRNSWGCPPKRRGEIEPANVFPAGLPAAFVARPLGSERPGLHARRGLCHVALFDCTGGRRAAIRQGRRDALRRRVAPGRALYPDGLLAASCTLGAGPAVSIRPECRRPGRRRRGRDVRAQAARGCPGARRPHLRNRGRAPGFRTTVAATCWRPAARASFARCGWPIKRRAGTRPTST